MPSFNIPDKSSYKLILEYLNVYFASQWDIREINFYRIEFLKYLLSPCPLRTLSIYLRQWGYEVCGQRIYQAMINQV